MPRINTDPYDIFSPSHFLPFLELGILNLKLLLRSGCRVFLIRNINAFCPENILCDKISSQLSVDPHRGLLEHMF